MKRISSLLLCALLCLSLVACGSVMKENQMYGDNYVRDESSLGSAGPNAGAPGLDTDVKNDGTGASSVYRDENVKLIRRAWFNIQSAEFDTALSALETLVEELDGYFESSKLYSGSFYSTQNDCRNGEYVVRIPAENYERFMAKADGIGYVTYRDESSEDIGAIYYDVESRLKTQRIKQERLQELLKRADNMEDIIALENALSEVEYLIESNSSELRRYDGLVDYATINITLEEVVRLTKTPGEKESLGERMKAGVVSSANGVVDCVRNVFIWISYNLFGVLIVAAVVVVIAVCIRRTVKKSKKKNTTAPESKDVQE